MSHNVDRKFCNLYTGKSEFNLVKMQKFDQIEGMGEVIKSENH